MAAGSTGPEVPRRPRREVTVADIARRAGVSAPTVSKVINGHGGVALATRRRIEEIIGESGYRRTESTGTTGIIEVVFQALDSLWALEIIRGVEEVARHYGIATAVTEMQGRVNPGNAWVEQMLGRRPVGVVAVSADLSDAQLTQLTSRAVPLVMLDPSGEPGHETPSVGAMNWNGGLAAGRHLIAYGHRRLAMINGPSAFLCCRARRDGFLAAAEAAGLEVAADRVIEAPFYVDGGAEAAATLMRLPDPPTGVFAANDLQALGVYAAAARSGLRIPEDLSVVGFDDLPFVRWSTPALTTVRQPLAEMGTKAAQIIMGMAVGEAPKQLRVELPTVLVVRSSTAPRHDV